MSQRSLKLHSIIWTYCTISSQSDRRLYRAYHIELYVNEEFGISDPNALDVGNVMFIFICLAIGIVSSILLLILEFLNKKWLGDLGLRKPQRDNKDVLFTPSTKSSRQARHNKFIASHGLRQHF